jgi:decaprenyl-phosphate phosphoribosyltransferase
MDNSRQPSASDSLNWPATSPVSLDSATPVPAEPPTRGVWLWRLGGMVRTTRPHQWVKNVFVLAPVVFAKDLFKDPEKLANTGLAFLVFCLLAGAVYTINDLADAESDRRHPVKRHRPVASGRVPTGLARGLAAGLILVSLGSAVWWFGGWFLLVATSYFAINLTYSFWLKHVAYLDVGCIAAGFVLRVVAGGLAAVVPVSNYLLLCTALLASFLGFGKRRHELTAARSDAKRQRAALESYARSGLDWALWVTALATIGTYVAYTLDPHTRRFFQSDWLWPSTALVCWGVLRFVHIVRHRPHAESPTQEMLKDGPFVLSIVLWAVLVLWVVYKLQPGVT